MWNISELKKLCCLIGKKKSIKGKSGKDFYYIQMSLLEGNCEQTEGGAGDWEHGERILKTVAPNCRSLRKKFEELFDSSCLILKCRSPLTGNPV